MYEVVWARMLSILLGSTFEAVSTVITSFMFGLAFGSFLAGRLSGQLKNPLKTYAILEVFIGFFALAFYYFIFYGASWHRNVHLFFGEVSIIPDAILYLSSFFFGALPTIMMGATFPVISMFFIKRRGDTGRGVGILYGFNTLGAVLGAFASGFVIIPLMGMKKATYFAASINLAVFISVLVIDKLWNVEVTKLSLLKNNERVPIFPKNRIFVFFLFVFALAGFTSMAYEVAWTRLLTMVIGNSVYAFSAILTVYLSGIALGSFTIARYADGIKKIYLFFCVTEFAIFFFVLVLLYMADWLPFLFIDLFKWVKPSFVNTELITFIVVITVVFIPSLFMGATFPIFNRIFVTRTDNIGGGIGNVYSANTVGGIFGALIAGFYYIPTYGIQKTILFTAGINLFIGIAVAVQSPFLKEHSKSIMVIIFGFLFAFYSIWVPKWNNKILNMGVYVYAEWYKYADKNFGLQFDRIADERELIFFEEGKGSTVAVTKTDEISLQINGKTDAGTTRDDMITQTMLSVLPLLLHKGPERALIIGLGSGVSLGAAENFYLKEIDCVEILPAVVRANKYFKSINKNALDDPRIKLLIRDGRHHLELTDKKYDVIVSEPSNPWIKGMSNLFTEEFFSIARERLDEGGIMAQWLQIYSLSEDGLKIILNTFKSIFPHSSVWYFGGEDLIIVGSTEKIINYEERLKRIYHNPELLTDLKGLEFDDYEKLINARLLDERKVKKFTEMARINRDDHPIIEFEMPKYIYRPTANDNIAAMRGCC